MERNAAAFHQTFGALKVYRETAALAHMVGTPRSTQDGLAVPVLRGDPRGAGKIRLRLIDDDGRMVGQEDATLATDDLSRLDEVVDHVLANRAATAAAIAEPVAEYRRRLRAAAEELRTALSG